MRPARFWLRSLGGVGTLSAALLLGLTAAPTAPAAPTASEAPAAAPAAATHEAENAVISQGVVESNHTGFTGTGFVNYNNDTGSYLQWTYGKPIQLRGMSTHGLQWYSQCVTSGSLDALATDWNADVLRISMYIQEGGYETDPRKFTDLVHSIIEQATARGMYAIVDWHMLSPGDPNHNLSRAKTFFTESRSATPTRTTCSKKSPMSPAA